VYCATGIPVRADPGHEYYLFKLIISRGATVGGCAGCDVPTILDFFYTALAQPSGAPGGNFCVLGQGSGEAVSYNASATPTRSPSWGAIKALYH
jgi:hypothetical protein